MQAFIVSNGKTLSIEIKTSPDSDSPSFFTIQLDPHDNRFWVIANQPELNKLDDAEITTALNCVKDTLAIYGRKQFIDLSDITDLNSNLKAKFIAAGFTDNFSDIDYARIRQVKAATLLNSLARFSIRGRILQALATQLQSHVNKLYDTEAVLRTDDAKREPHMDQLVALMAMSGFLDTKVQDYLAKGKANLPALAHNAIPVALVHDSVLIAFCRISHAGKQGYLQDTLVNPALVLAACVSALARSTTVRAGLALVVAISGIVLSRLNFNGLLALAAVTLAFVITIATQIKKIHTSLLTLARIVGMIAVYQAATRYAADTHNIQQLTLIAPPKLTDQFDKLMGSYKPADLLVRFTAVTPTTSAAPATSATSMMELLTAVVKTVSKPGQPFISPLTAISEAAAAPSYP